MKKKELCLVVLGILVTATLFGAFSQSGEDLFQKALRLERNEGKLMEAIELYQKVVAEQGSKILGAQAQLRIGMCYEKLGSNKIKLAEDAFRKVVNNYPMQSEEVKIAREKLAILLRAQTPVEKGDEVFRIQKIWDNLDVVLWNLDSVSPDGQYISFTDRNGGDLSILDLSTKKRRRLTDNFPKFEKMEELSRKEILSLVEKMKFVYGSVWSPDSTKLAYSWTGRAGGGDLRIMKLDGSQPRVLLHNEDYFVMKPLDWSLDGKSILTAFLNEDMTGQIVLIKDTNGSLRVLKKFDMPLSESRFMLLPDDRHMVYDMAQMKESSERDIFLYSLYEGKEIKLVDHPSDDYILGLSPDGKKLLFASTRRGTLDAWAIGIKGGQSQRNPELIQKDLGEINPIGFDMDGSFYYGMRDWISDVYTTVLDKEKALVQTPAVKVDKSFEGTNIWPDWSSDGKFLAFVSSRHLGSDYSWFLHIQSLETGQESELLLTDFTNLRPSIRWSFDGNSILFTGNKGSDREGIYEIDVNTGDVSTLKTFDSNVMKARWPMWSSDKKKLFYGLQVFDEPEGTWKRLMVFNPESGQEKELYREKSWPTLMALSPDEQWLAFQTLNMDTLLRSLNVMPVSGGELREILKLGKGELISSVAWMPDGKSLIFARYIDLKKCGLWQISIEGGKPWNLDLEMQRLRSLSIHPDGQRIAFSSAEITSSIWTMENFLLKDKSNK